MTRTMDLMRMDPDRSFRRLFGDFDRLFGPRQWQWPLETTRTSLGEFPWLPELEMKEKDGYLTVKFNLPGVNKEEVTVTVEKGVLTIEGERKREAETKKDEWFTTERTYGRFFRSIPVPEGVRPEDVKATFANGVLEVTAHLGAAVAAPAPKKIAVEEGATKTGGEAAPEKAAKAVA